MKNRKNRKEKSIRKSKSSQLIAELVFIIQFIYQNTHNT